jgi:hypothetical protein
MVVLMEYVMGVTYDTAGTAPYYSSSGFAAGTMPDAKYYDIYTYGTTYNDAAAYTRGKLGDATKEVVKASSSTWYGSTPTSLSLVVLGLARRGLQWWYVRWCALLQ